MAGTPSTIRTVLSSPQTLRHSHGTDWRVRRLLGQLPENLLPGNSAPIVILVLDDSSDLPIAPDWPGIARWGCSPSNPHEPSSPPSDGPGYQRGRSFATVILCYLRTEQDPGALLGPLLNPLLSRRNRASLVKT